MTTERTPTPWHLRADTDDMLICASKAGTPTVAVVEYAATGSNPHQAANAAFIVQAVNSHDMLVKALEEWNRLDSMKGLNPALRKKMKTYAHNLTWHALRLAKGED